MNKTKKSFSIGSVLCGAILALTACRSGYLKYEKSEQLNDIKEFDQQVKIEDEKAGSAQEPSPAPAPAPEEPKKGDKKKKTKATKKAKELPTIVSTKHEPELEGQTGFVLRRPVKDPFRVGEKVVHEVNYFNVKAGDLTMSVKPFSQVNGRRNYKFNIAIKTSSLFSTFYSVEDEVTSLVDFENLVPSVFTLHVKETSQLREARFFIDPKKREASYWEKKVTEKNGAEEKKLQWEVPEYSQDVFSSAFYMRAFTWTVGAENSFRVADNGENLIFRGKALRKEEISTHAGKFKAIVIKPDIELRGQFKPVGDIFIWLSDDDRKFILRIESKIKIGTIVSEIIKLDPGQD